MDGSATHTCRGSEVSAVPVPCVGGSRRLRVFERRVSARDAGIPEPAAGGEEKRPP